MEALATITKLLDNNKAYAAGLTPPLTALTAIVINWGNTGVWDWDGTRIIIAGVFVGIITGVITWAASAGKAHVQITPGSVELPVTSDEDLEIEPDDADLGEDPTMPLGMDPNRSSE